MNHITERLKHIAKEKGLSIRQLEESIEASNGTLQKAIQRQSDINSAWLEKIVRIHKVNAIWLITGMGEMYSQGNAVPVDIGDRVVMNVPLINQYAYAGYLRGYSDIEYVDALPKVPWLVDREYKGKYLTFEVRGDSMDDNSRDSYIEGDLLLCREIARDLWVNSKLHIKKWDFVIVHKTEGVIVKRIIDHDVKKATLTLHSLNDQYADYTIHLKDVFQIFNVVKVERKK